MKRSKLFKISSSAFLLIALMLGVYLVGVKTGFLNFASGSPANLVVDVSTSFDNPADCWKNLAQGGESKSRMLASVIPNVRSLGPKYVRIDHIYDNYDVVTRSGGQILFNWASLDATISDIRAMGATPFLSLSYMPPAISKNGNVDSLPTSFGDWQYVVNQTVQHVSGRAGLNIPNVYYEVWNEPDIFGSFSPADYSNLYYYAQAGANSATNVNFFKIGGAATSGLYQRWFDPLLQMAQNGKVRLDFYSWHNYYSDINSYDTDLQNVNKWLASYPNLRDLELDVTEMGIDSKNNTAYDNGFSAVNTLAAVAVLQGNTNKCFSFEIVDGAGPSQYWGRWGILTNEKFGSPVDKPRFYALQFLNQMGGKRMSVSGVGTWVKSFVRFDGTNIKIFVVNYDPQGSHGEIVPVELTNMPFKNFTYKRINYGGGSTSVEVSIDPSATTWSTTEAFQPNTAAILEITPH